MNNIFKEDKVGKAKEEARDFYQIKEKDGEIWLTYNGAPVVPESMLKEPALDTLLKVRELYVQSRTRSVKESNVQS